MLANVTYDEHEELSSLTVAESLQGWCRAVYDVLAGTVRAV